jgi:hypothetical protein
MESNEIDVTDVGDAVDDVKENKSKFEANKDDSEGSNSSEYEDEPGTGCESDNSSIYSTKNPDVIHQRKKEKQLKKRSLAKAIGRGHDLEVLPDDLESTTGTNVSASVGTSKISIKSFRHSRNLDKFNIVLQPYKRLETIKELSIKNERLKHEIANFKLIRQATRKWKEKMREMQSKPKLMRLEPTYRVEPRVKLRLNEILATVKASFEKLIKKSDKYDPQYTPKFVKIASEILKNDVKAFFYDRYKIIIHLMILQKVISQSCLITSACLWYQETDKKICINLDTQSFYAVCYIFMVYHE